MTAVEFETWVVWFHFREQAGDVYSLSNWLKLTKAERRKIYSIPVFLEEPIGYDPS